MHSSKFNKAYDIQKNSKEYIKMVGGKKFHGKGEEGEGGRKGRGWLEYGAKKVDEI